MPNTLYDINFDEVTDSRWGDALRFFGPFIVTTKGLFTDHGGSEYFLTYSLRYQQPQKYIRSITHGMEFDQATVTAKVVSLFDLFHNVNPNITSFKEHQEQFDRAVRYIRSKELCD